MADTSSIIELLNTKNRPCNIDWHSILIAMDMIDVDRELISGDRESVVGE